MRDLSQVPVGDELKNAKTWLTSVAGRATAPSFLRISWTLCACVYAHHLCQKSVALCVCFYVCVLNKSTEA